MSKRGAVFTHTIVIQRQRAWRGFRWASVLFWRGSGLQRERGFCSYLINRWGIKRPPNGTKFDRRSTGDVPRPLDKSRPIPRMFFSRTRKETRGVRQVHMGVSDCETDNVENARMQETNTYAKEMHMMTWYEMHDMNKMQNKDKTQPRRK